MRFGSFTNDELVTETIEGELDGIGLQRVDEVASVARPTAVQTFYVEEEIAYRSEQQVIQWQADGVVAARTAATQVGGLTPLVEDLEQRIERQRTAVESARSDLENATAGLAHHVRRPVGAGKLFYARLAALLLGDIAGVASASINFGVIPWMAVLQAVAIGAAATTAGLAGQEWKDLQRARDLERDREDLTEAEQPFAQLFAGPKAGEAYARIGIWVAASVLLLIFGGMFAVQSASDGLAAGVLFGCLGAAIGLASAVNYWVYTDHVADLIDHASSRVTSAEASLDELSNHQALAEYGQATAELASIEKEHALRGEAARLHMLALGKKVMRNNTGVVGHGHAPAAELEPSPVGREALIRRNGHTNGHHGQEVGAS